MRAGAAAVLPGPPVVAAAGLAGAGLAGAGAIAAGFAGAGFAAAGFAAGSPDALGLPPGAGAADGFAPAGAAGGGAAEARAAPSAKATANTRANHRERDRVPPLFHPRAAHVCTIIKVPRLPRLHHITLAPLEPGIRPVSGPDPYNVPRTGMPCLRRSKTTPYLVPERVNLNSGGARGPSSAAGQLDPSP